MIKWKDDRFGKFVRLIKFWEKRCYFIIAIALCYHVIACIGAFHLKHALIHVTAAGIVDLHCNVFPVIFLSQEQQHFSLVNLCFFNTYRITVKCFCKNRISFCITAEPERYIVKTMIGSFAAVSLKEIEPFFKCAADLSSSSKAFSSGAGSQFLYIISKSGLWYVNCPVWTERRTYDKSKIFFCKNQREQ